MTTTRAIINTLPYVASTLCIVGFVRLGFWQLDRAADKEQLFSEYQRSRTEQPRHLASYQALPAYTPVSLVGSFPDVVPVLLENQRHRGQLGFHVYRVFQPDSGPALLVNLGWVAGDGPSGLAVPQVLPENEEAALIEGLVRDPPGVGIRLGDQLPLVAAENGLRTPYIAMQTLEQSLQVRLAPQIVLLTTPNDGYVRDWEPAILPPERHRGYAVQWFSMTAAVLIITAILMVRQRRRARNRNYE